MMKIHRLPSNLQRAITSGYVLSDVTQCVLELVYNALDARASSVAIRANLKKFYLQVVDNGCGMTKDELDLIGEEYITSKLHREDQLDSIMDTFGYRGCALAALARTCSLLEIQTRHQSGTATYKKTIENGRLGPVEMSSSTRPAWGSTVTVNDIFRALPVRRQRIKDIFDLDGILHQLESLAVIYPDVSFSLRNDMTGKVLLQTHRHGDCKPTLAQIFGLAENRLLVPIRFHQETITISGSICRALHSDSSLQLIYVNNRLVQNAKIHSLVLKDMNKYCRFWEKDRDKSDMIVDLEGYVFIVKIALPYHSFSIERNGRKATVQLQNADEVYMSVHRALKECLQNDEFERSACSMESSMVKNEKGRGTDFGPSQLEFTLRGKQVKRMREPPEQLLEVNEEIADSPQNIPVIGIAEEVATKPENRCKAEILKCSQNNVKTKRGNVERDSFKTPTGAAKNHTEKENYLQMFFRESSGEGTTLAENAPIFELGDFSRQPFHDFLAWLKVKASHDKGARKLLAELAPVQQKSNVVHTNKPAPLVPLKEIRKQKFAASSRVMLNRLQKMSSTYKETFQNNAKQEALVNRKMRTRTTTYIETQWCPDDSVAGTTQLPQVSFNEFMWWLKMKASHGEIVSVLLTEFKKFKKNEKLFISQPPTPISKPTAIDSVRRPEISGQRVIEVPNAGEKPGKRKLAENSPHVPRKKNSRLDPSTKEAKSREKNVMAKGSQPEKLTSPLYSSYYSHYQHSQSITKPPAEVAPTQSHGATQQRLDTSLTCLDEIPDSDQSPEFRQEKNLTSLLVKSVETRIYQTPLQMDKSPLIPLIRNFCDRAVQVSVEMATASIQAGSRVSCEGKSVQTELSTYWQGKTARNHTVRPALQRETETSSQLTGENSKQVVPSSQDLQCGQFPREKPSSEPSKSTGELPIPVVDSEENLPDTMAADPLWEPHTTETGKKFYVHSVSGNTSFNPPASSTRWSYGMQGVVGGVPQVSAPKTTFLKNLKEGDLAELRAAISESCEDSLANVKWRDVPESGRFGEKFVKWLEDGAKGSEGDLYIPIGQVPKTESVIHQLLSSFAFSRKHLKNLQVVGQLDRKFIVALMKKPDSDIPVICLFDQHAVDERITLERLMDQYTTNNEFEGEDLAIPLLLPVTPNTLNLVKNSPNHFIPHGLSLAAKDSQTCIVTSVPVCFVRKQEREAAAHRLALMKRLVTDLIDEVVKYSLDTRGSTVKKPKAIFNVIASEACRAAIKFNHSLDLNEMTALMAKLSACQQPFQCAHGRPTLVPAYELSDAKPQANKVNLKKFKRTERLSC